MGGILHKKALAQLPGLFSKVNGSTYQTAQTAPSEDKRLNPRLLYHEAIQYSKLYKGVIFNADTLWHPLTHRAPTRTYR